MFTTKCIVTSALALSLVAGTTASIAAAESAPPQSQHEQQRENADRQQDRNRPASETSRLADNDRTINPADLCYFSKLKGKEIRNSSGEGIAKVDDLLIDRYSGEVAGVVVSSGGVLGVGDTLHVVAPRELSPTADREALTASFTAKDIESRSTFDREAWKRGYEKGATDQSWWDGLMRDLGFDSYDPNEDARRYPDLASGNRVTIKGEVASVHRMDEAGAQRTEIYVRDGDKLRVVDLGPTWFIGASPAMPVRGDQVEIIAIEPAHAGETSDLVGVTIKSRNGEPVRLRDAGTYAPEWASRGASDPVYGLTGRMVLASDLVGDDVMCRTDTAGEVQDLVVDGGSHRVRMLVIDPNDNFLGIADKTRLVPINVAIISSLDKLYVDATKQMLLNAPQAPDEASQIGGMAETYRAFGVERNAWGTERSDAMRPGGDSQGYGGVTVLTGKIVRVEDTDGPQKVGRVCTIVIDDGARERRAIVGHAGDGSMKDVKQLANNKDVTIRTTALPVAGGEQWLVVQTITDRDGKVVFQQTRSFASAR